MCVCVHVYIWFCRHVLDVRTFQPREDIQAIPHTLTRTKVVIRFRFRPLLVEAFTHLSSEMKHDFNHFADLDTAYCVDMQVCLDKNKYHQHFGQSRCYVLPCHLCVLCVNVPRHTHNDTTLPSPPPPIFAMCACKAGGKQPVKWATPCLDTMGKHRTQSSRWRSYRALKKY